MVSKEVNVFWLGDAGASTVAVLPDRLGFQLAARSLHAHENRDRQSDSHTQKHHHDCNVNSARNGLQTVTGVNHTAMRGALWAQYSCCPQERVPSCFTGAQANALQLCGSSWQRVRPTCLGTWLLHVLSLGAAQAGCSGRVAQLAALACACCWGCGGGC